MLTIDKDREVVFELDEGRSYKVGIVNINNDSFYSYFNIECKEEIS
jgi:hypothetical protein